MKEFQIRPEKDSDRKERKRETTREKSGCLGKRGWNIEKIFKQKAKPDCNWTENKSPDFYGQCSARVSNVQFTDTRSPFAANTYELDVTVRSSKPVQSIC